MIKVIIPARYKTTHYLRTDCENCGAVLHLDESDRCSYLENDGIFCPECGNVITKFKRETIKITE